ncbi:hypothetical protein [Kitasatospora purpeofusca]|uniref:hypothetical protein n=1 Tax=Kitasatospora purpeofusca TaxID=67352 RepID=UPI0036532BD6
MPLLRILATSASNSSTIRALTASPIAARARPTVITAAARATLALLSSTTEPTTWPSSTPAAGPVVERAIT